MSKDRGKGPGLRLVESLQKSIETEDALLLNGHDKTPENVVILEDRRLERRIENAGPMDITPRELMDLALAKMEELGNVKKIYMTMVAEEGDQWTTHNLRAGLHIEEEIAFRALAQAELMDTWRGK